MKDRMFGGLWALAWMWPLIGPAGAVLTGRVHHPVGAGLGLLGFVGIYLVVVTNAFDSVRPRVTPVDVTLLCALAGIGITLVAAYGDRPTGWLNLMLYVSVAGAALLRTVAAAMWSLSVVGVLVGYAIGTEGRGEIPDVAQIAFGILLAATLVQTLKRMLGYVRILRATRTQLARAAVGEERLRFARDLHDLLGHTMSLIVVKAEVVRRLVDRDPVLAASAAADIERIGRQALSEVRQAVDGYRAPDLSGELDGVRIALGDVGIVARVAQTGPTPPRPVSDVFAWVVREATTNVIRHSGAATCQIDITVDAGAATARIADNGRGTRDHPPGEATGTGVGLVGLRERLGAIGGTLTTGERPGGGFQVVATVPAAAWPAEVDVAVPA